MSTGEKIYEFTGNIVVLEEIRGLSSSLVWGEAGGMLAAAVWQAGRTNRRKVRKGRHDE